MHKRTILSLLFIALCSPSLKAANIDSAASTDKPSIEHVMLLALDGFSAPGLKQARTPNIDKLAQDGTFLSRSRGVMPTKSAPNWASILSGVYPSHHGIHSNQWWWFRCTRRLEYPTLFSAIKSADAKNQTATIFEWDDFGKLFHPKDLDHNQWVGDWDTTTQEVTKLLDKGTPKFTVIHLVSADIAGHDHSWTSSEYIQGIEFVDSQVGTIVEKLKSNGTFDKTLLVLATDHGGVDDGHGGDSDVELYTNVVFHGPGIKKGLRLKGMTQNVDITATLYDVLQLTPEASLQGIPLKIIWEKQSP